MSLQHTHTNLSNKVYDLAIIGGGINATAIAADAAIKGLSVCLLEKDSLAAATSSASSNLIHGGLRYLEQYDFKLVREALKDQIIWQQRAPHLVKPLPFIFPYEKHLRPKWLIRTGLWIYDHLVSKKQLPKTKTLSRKNHLALAPLKKHLTTGFEYYDCQTHGAALTIANARLAKHYGADIICQAMVTNARAIDNQWQVSYQSDQQTKQIQAKVLVNATGPWVAHTQQQIIDSHETIHLQTIKGSHIVVPKLYDGDHAYILQHEDGRIIFALPYTSTTTAIGTTDIRYDGDLDNIQIADDEQHYLCALINHYFNKQLTTADIIESWSGVRALAATDSSAASKMSREHQIIVSNENAPVIHIVGGKLTNARLVAEETMAKLKPYLPDMSSQSTKQISYLGGDLDANALLPLQQHLQQQYPFIEAALLQRWINQFGSETSHFLQDITCLTDLGFAFGHGLYQHEVDYLTKHFFAFNAEDILFKLTRLYTVFNQQQTERLAHYLQTGEL